MFNLHPYTAVRRLGGKDLDAGGDCRITPFLVAVWKSLNSRNEGLRGTRGLLKNEYKLDQFRYIIFVWEKQHLFLSQTSPIYPNILRNVVTLVV